MGGGGTRNTNYIWKALICLPSSFIFSGGCEPAGHMPDRHERRGDGLTPFSRPLNIQPAVVSMPPTKRKADALSGAHPSERESKKSSRHADESTVPIPDLPAPMWGRVLEFLPYGDVRKALLICRAVYFEATATVRYLFIHHANEIDVRAARRFVNVEAIVIGCILKNGFLNANAVGRVVPFMTSFPNLKQCKVGTFDITSSSRKRSQYTYRLKRCKDPVDHSALYRSMLEALCGAFESNALSKSIHLPGFMTPGRVYSCAPSVERARSKCRLCRRIINCFPLNQIIQMQGTCGNEYIGKFQGFCISHEECLTIIRSRSWTRDCFIPHPNGLLYLSAKSMKRAVTGESPSPSAENFHFIFSARLDLIELWAELACRYYRKHRPIKMKVNKRHALQCMNPRRPRGGYVLERKTFDRLVNAGYRLEESDFAAIVDAEE